MDWNELLLFLFLELVVTCFLVYLIIRDYRIRDLRHKVRMEICRMGTNRKLFKDFESMTHIDMLFKRMFTPLDEIEEEWKTKMDVFGDYDGRKNIQQF